MVDRWVYDHKCLREVYLHDRLLRINKALGIFRKSDNNNTIHRAWGRAVEVAFNN